MICSLLLRWRVSLISCLVGGPCNDAGVAVDASIPCSTFEGVISTVAVVVLPLIFVEDLSHRLLLFAIALLSPRNFPKGVLPFLQVTDGIESIALGPGDIDESIPLIGRGWDQMVLADILSCCCYYLELIRVGIFVAIS